MRTRAGIVRALLREALTLPEEEGDWSSGGLASRQIVSADDIFSEVLAPLARGARRKAGLAVVVPFVCRKEFEPDTLFGRLNIAWASENVADVRPSDVMETVLHGSKKLALARRERGVRSGFTLEMKEDERSRVIETLAAALAEHLRDAGIAYVTPVGSTSDVPNRLAERVAELIGARMAKSFFLRKVRNPGEMRPLDPAALRDPRFARDPAARRALERDYEKTAKHVKSRLERGLVPTSSDVYGASAGDVRKYMSIHRVSGEPPTGRKMLVIDDNVQTGATFAAVRRELVGSGVRPEDITFAAGWDWPR